MGVQQSLISNTPPPHLLQHYQIIQRSENSQVTYLLHKQSKRQHFMRTLIANNPQERDNINKLATHKISAKSQYLIQLNQKAEVKQEGYCSNQFKFYLIFQRPYKTLKTQIEERKINNKTFTEKELVELLRTCIFALMFLREINQPHENISSDNIFLSKAGDFFLSDPWLNFQPNVFTSVYRVYDSPEKLEVKSNLTYKNVNPHCSDLFSLGMVMLEAIYLRSMNDAYSDKTINFTFLREKMSKIPYPELKGQLEGLLDYKPKRRLSVAFQIQAFSDEKEQSRYNLIPTFQANRKQFTIKTANRTKLNKINTEYGQESLQTYQTRETKQPKQPVAVPRQDNSLERTKSPSLPKKQYKCNLQSGQINVTIEAQPASKSIVKSQYPSDSQVLGEQNNDSYIKVEQNISILQIQEEKPQQQKQQAPIEQIVSQQQKINIADTSQPSLSKVSKIDQCKQQRKFLSQQLIEQTQTPTPRVSNKKRKFHTTIMQVDDSENNSCAEEYDLEFAIQKYQIGSKYEGYKKNGMKNGKGKFSYHDGGYYEGMWKNDKMNGEGKLYYSSGKLAYEGEWKEDEFYGYGKVYNDSVAKSEIVNYENFNLLEDEWEYFEGNLVSDSKQGFGKIKFSSGEMFEGEFVNDKMDGKGRFIKKDGGVINGLWKNSKFVVRL